MPKTPARTDYLAQSFRFTPEQAAVLKEEAKRLGSTTTFIRQLIDDYRTMSACGPFDAKYGSLQLDPPLVADLKTRLGPEAVANHAAAAQQARAALMGFVEHDRGNTPKEGAAAAREGARS